MATELWRWQNGTTSDEALYAIDVADDGSVICGGVTYGSWVGVNAGDYDIVAVKLSANGTEEWRWQGGNEGYDGLDGIAIGKDGSAFLIGAAEGTWGAISAGDLDYTMTKISSEGIVMWRWQAGTSAYDYLLSGAVRSDGSVFAVGITYGNWSGEEIGSSDFAGAMIDADGNELWRWMNGTTSLDYAWDVTFAENNSIIVCGTTSGSFGGPNLGSDDMVVIKLSSDGDFLWAWQGGTDAEDSLSKCPLGSDGSIYLAGSTLGNWGGINAGEEDFVAAKLDADGNEIWRWQDGTPAPEQIFGAAIAADGSLFLAGYTYGNWSAQVSGFTDFVIVELHPDNGAVVWRWQEGTSDFDWMTEVASSGDKVVFGGNVNGDWVKVSAGETDFAVIMMESTESDNSSYSTVSPTNTPLEVSTPITTPAPSSFQQSTSESSSGSSPQPSSLAVESTVPTPFPSSSGRGLLTVSPVSVPPTVVTPDTPVPIGSGSTRPPSVPPSSPSSSSTSSSSTGVAIVSGISGAIIGIVITGLVVFLLGKRRARRSAPEAQSQPRRHDTLPAPPVASRPPPPDYHASTAYSQSHA